MNCQLVECFYFLHLILTIYSNKKSHFTEFGLILKKQEKNYNHVLAKS